MPNPKLPFLLKLKTAGAVLLVIVLLPILAPYAVMVLLFRGLRHLMVYALIWLTWLPRGRDVLVVTSNSPNWQGHMATEILPMVGGRAVVLNWSERGKWSRWSLASQAFCVWGGEREFNPLIVVFRPFRRAKVFRLWQAFRDAKHGRTSSLEGLQEELRRDCDPRPLPSIRQKLEPPLK